LALDRASTGAEAEGKANLLKVIVAGVPSMIA
jgi:hypothetical protein